MLFVRPRSLTSVPLHDVIQVLSLSFIHSLFIHLCTQIWYAWICFVHVVHSNVSNFHDPHITFPFSVIPPFDEIVGDITVHPVGAVVFVHSASLFSFSCVNLCLGFGGACLF